MTPQPCASNLARLLKVRCRSCLMPQQADLAQRRIGRGSIPSACKSHRVSKEAREGNLPLFHRTPGRQTTSASHVASQSVQAVTTARRRYLLKLKHRLEPAARSEKQQKNKATKCVQNAAATRRASCHPLLADRPSAHGCAQASHLFAAGMCRWSLDKRMAGDGGGGGGGCATTDENAMPVSWASA